jgi:hypothetical protein
MNLSVSTVRMQSWKHVGTVYFVAAVVACLSLIAAAVAVASNSFGGESVKVQRLDIASIASRPAELPVTYYIVASEEQADLVRQVEQFAAMERSSVGVEPYQPYVVFIADTPEKEMLLADSQFLRFNPAVDSPRAGVTFRVLDMRGLQTD